MHDYMRAVGFSSIQNKKEFQEILEQVIREPDFDSAEVSGGLFGCAEKSRDFLAGAGITVRGYIDENGEFNYEYCFPHYNGRYNCFKEDVAFEKLADREEYNGVCDLLDQGVSVIFHMNRLLDYAGSLSADRRKSGAHIRLSALSISGKVLIPLQRSREEVIRQAKDAQIHRNMLSAARQGDQDALENLTIQDIDLYTSLMKRIPGEDILSIVETYFMPYGIAVDQYSVLGDILSCREEVNELTGEKVWQMLISCNGLYFDMCINSRDLLGTPAPRRRFRGNIWLQGCIDHEDDNKSIF